MNLTPTSWGSPLREANDCHLPAGSPEGGQFCSDVTSAPRSRAATHEGTCQLCGHQQMLPGGKLSIHGYSVKWSMFVGRCPGSQHKPFEQSIDLIERSIDDHTEAAQRLRTWAEKLRTDNSGTKAWFSIYQPAEGYRGGFKGGYEWQELEITPETRTYPGETRTYQIFNITPKKRDGSPKRPERVEPPYGKGIDTLPDVVRWANARRAAEIDALAKSHDDYVVWQRGRIKGWKPTELKARRNTTPAPDAPLTRVRRGQWVLTPDGKSREVAGASNGVAIFRKQGGGFDRIPIKDLKRFG